MTKELQQSLPLEVHEPHIDYELIPSISSETRAELLKLAERRNVSCEELLKSMLFAEVERQRLLECSRELPVASDEAPLEILALSKLCRDHLSGLNFESEIYEIRSHIETLYYELVDQNLIAVRTMRNSIVESSRIKVPRTAYYWYAGSISQHVSRWFGCHEIYLYDERFATNSEFVFVGMPANVEVSKQVFIILNQIFKGAKTAYKRSLRFGSKAEIENEANEFISQRIQALYDVQAYIESQGEDYPDGDEYVLYDYQKEHYAYTIR